MEPDAAHRFDILFTAPHAVFPLRALTPLVIRGDAAGKFHADSLRRSRADKASVFTARNVLLASCLLPLVVSYPAPLLNLNPALGASSALGSGTTWPMVRLRSRGFS